MILGSAQLLGPATSLGVRAALLAVACALPEMPVRVLLAEGPASRQRQQFADLFQVAEAVTARFGIPGLKFAMDLAGLQGGACRLPLLPLQKEEKAELRRVIVPFVEAA